MIEGEDYTYDEVHKIVQIESRDSIQSCDEFSDRFEREAEGIGVGLGVDTIVKQRMVPIVR